MKLWISKLRTQRARERLRDSERRSAREDRPWWNQTPIGLLLGCLAWVANCALLYASPSAPVRDINASLAIAGSELLLLVGMLVSGSLLMGLAVSLLRNNAKLLLLAMVSLATTVPGELLLHNAWSALPSPVAQYLIPYALAPLLATVLLGGGAGIVAGFWTSFTLAVFADRSLIVLATGMLGVAVTACAAQHVRRRTQLLKIGLLAGLVEMLVVATQIPSQSLVLTVFECSACLLGGLFAALGAMLLLPLFETAFGITTDITLLELSDLGHPLLQRLAFEAPGTYHHSLMVASLAQTAADEIGANAVLARTASYFHDIGKLTKPDYFSENMLHAGTPHDSLTPSMSSLLIMGHVKEGLSLAMLYRLPQPLLDVIQQHHGTGLVAYFHHKAGQQLQLELQSADAKAGSVDESAFRYSGPRPSSREAGIVLLADSVEAASRSMGRPTSAQIHELTERIVRARFEDGQLDNCGLTFAELSRVRRSFVFCLTNMMHTRVAYPTS